MEENKNPDTPSRKWNGKQRIRRAMVALVLCLLPECIGNEGKGTDKGYQHAQKISAETTVKASENSITPLTRKFGQ